MISHVFEKLIIKATNPGQFENNHDEPVGLLKMEHLLLKQQLLAKLMITTDSSLSNCYTRSINVNESSQINIFTKLNILPVKKLFLDTSSISDATFAKTSRDKYFSLTLEREIFTTNVTMVQP